MDVCLVIKQRLEELGLEQRDLAAAAQVTESYISQLLTGKKLPPAPGRTDIYDKMGKFLNLPNGKLAKLAEHQRNEELKRTLISQPAPLFKEVRNLILHKCRRHKQVEIRAIFEQATVRRTRTSGHAKASGGSQRSGEGRIGKRNLAPLGGSHRRPKL